MTLHKARARDGRSRQPRGISHPHQLLLRTRSLPDTMCPHRLLPSLPEAVSTSYSLAQEPSIDPHGLWSPLQTLPIHPKLQQNSCASLLPPHAYILINRSNLLTPEHSPNLPISRLLLLLAPPPTAEKSCPSFSRFLPRPVSIMHIPWFWNHASCFPQ